MEIDDRWDAEDAINWSADTRTTGTDVETLPASVNWCEVSLEVDAEALAALIHYPECWDTACYDTLQSALHERLSGQICTTCDAEEPNP